MIIKKISPDCWCNIYPDTLYAFTTHKITRDIFSYKCRHCGKLSHIVWFKQDGVNFHYKMTEEEAFRKWEERENDNIQTTT